MWRKPQIWLGVLISVVALYLAFRDIHWQEVVDALANAQYLWLIPSILVLIVAVLTRGLRWYWLFGEQRDRLPLSRYVNATAIGYLITNTLPLRLGELARVFFIARDGKVSYALAASTIVVEHVLDVLMVLSMLLVILMTGTLPVPDMVKQGATVAGVLFGGALLVMLLLVWQRRRVLTVAEKVIGWIPRLNTHKWVKAVGHVLDGFAVLRPGQPLFMVVFWTIIGWLLSVVSFHFCLLAFIPDAPFSYSVFAIIASTFILLLPATPGALGTLDWAIQQSLAAFGVPLAMGLSVAVVFHVMEIIVMDLMGVVCLLREAGSWSQAKASLRAATAQQPALASEAGADAVSES
jgi:hypothetical protein